MGMTRNLVTITPHYIVAENPLPEPVEVFTWNAVIWTTTRSSHDDLDPASAAHTGRYALPRRLIRIAHRR
jgi:hypothetical protein